MYSRGYYKAYGSTINGNLVTVCGSLWEHSNQQFLENMESILQELFDKRPSSFGYHFNAKKHLRGQYVLALKLAAPGQKAVLIDLNDIKILRERNRHPDADQYRTKQEERRQQRLQAVTL